MGKSPKSPWYLSVLAILGLFWLLYLQTFGPRPLEWRLFVVLATCFTVIVIPDLAESIESIVKGWFGRGK